MRIFTSLIFLLLSGFPGTHLGAGTTDTLTAADTSVAAVPELTSSGNEPPASSSAAAPPAEWKHARVLIVDKGINIESTESDVIDGFDYATPPNLMLGESETPSGLGLLITGCVISTLAAALTISFVSKINTIESSGELAASLTGCSLVTAYSVLSVTFGIHRLRHHIRMDNRYIIHSPPRPEGSRRKEAAATVVRKTSR